MDGRHQGLAVFHGDRVLRPRQGGEHLHIPLLLPQVHGGVQRRGPQRICLAVVEKGQLRICQIHGDTGAVVDLQVQVVEGEGARCPDGVPGPVHVQPVGGQVVVQRLQCLGPDGAAFVRKGHGNENLRTACTGLCSAHGLAHGHSPVLRRKEPAVVLSLRRGGRAGVGPGGEGGHGARRVLLWGHAGRQVPHRLLQAVVRHPDVIAADEAVLRLQQPGELAGEGPDLTADAALNVVHLVLDLVQPALQRGKDVVQNQDDQQHGGAGRGGRSDFPPSAPPGAPGRFQILRRDGLHRRQLPVRQLSRRGGVLGIFDGGGLLRGLRRLHPQQGADSDAEDPAHGDQIFQLRHGGVRLPLAHRLAADAQPLPQGLLGEAGGLPPLLDAAAQSLLLHTILSFAASTIAELGQKHNHRRVSPVSTGSCGRVFTGALRRGPCGRCTPARRPGCCPAQARTPGPAP